MRNAVHVLALLEFSSPIGEEVRGELAKVVAATRAEDGCLSYRAYVPEEGAVRTRIMFQEQWRDRGVLERHLNTPHLLAFRNAMAPLMTGPSEVTLWEELP
ncbi:MAG: putative quinol monooxygenase [Desulfovibrionaceae bacterium]